MRLQYAPEDEAFRAELIAWLDAHLPVATSVLARAEAVERAPARLGARRGSARCSTRAGSCPGWPPELGGRNATPTQQMIYFEEMSRREIPRSANPQGLGIIAPSIHDYGTPEQKERFLAADAARRDRVVPRHERARRGQRPREPARPAPCSTATSSSSTARRCGRRARTTPTGASASCAPIPTCPKHKGISALIIDMTTPGVERRPFPELTDPDFCDFNEVFFTDVRVPEGEPRRPAQRRLADHAGLARARAGDALDRLRVQRCNARCSALIELGRPTRRPTAAGSATTTAFRDAVGGVLRRRAGAAWRWATAASRSSWPGKSAPEHSLLKLYGSEAVQTALLVRRRGARRRRRSTSTCLGPQMWREGSWAIAVPALVRRHDPGRHERDPAQHHRRARARPSSMMAPCSAALARLPPVRRSAASARRLD